MADALDTAKMLWEDVVDVHLSPDQLARAVTAGKQTIKPRISPWERLLEVRAMRAIRRAAQVLACPISAFLNLRRHNEGGA